MREAGIDRAVFLQKVYFPILKYLGVTRHETLHASKAMQAKTAESTDEQRLLRAL